MFCKIDQKSPIVYEIEGIGHSKTEKKPDAFNVVTQNKFLRTLPKEVQAEVCKDGKTIGEVAKVWNKIVWPKRTFFDGSTAELAMLAVQDCFENALNRNFIDFDPGGIDLIIGATNTGPGYSSLADYVKRGIGINPPAARRDENSLVNAECWDLTEACTSGSVAITKAIACIAGGMYKRVLVVCSEKATTLTPREKWQGSNLFGDASFAMMLKASTDKTKQSFYFFENNCFPFDGNIEFIRKTETGFFQDGRKVHRFVGGKVIPTFVDSVKRAGIEVEDISHIIFHQPSLKTVEFSEEELRKLWPNFKGKFHKSKNIGNASSASFGHLVSTKYQEGIIKPGEMVVTLTFGAGLSLSILGFRFTEC